MRQAIRSRCRPALQPATDRVCRGASWIGVLVVSSIALAASSVARAEVTYHSDCQVVDTTRLANFGHDGSPAQLSHFTCHIIGGPLHGSFVTGTNIWDMSNGTGGVLLGSIAIAQRAGSNVLYEVHDGTRHQQTREGKVAGWGASSWGVYTSATGAAAALKGKTFTSVVHSTGPRTFTVENVINGD
jgi:hypothetical protein